MSLAALAGGLAMGTAMFLTFRLVGFGDGDGLLLDPRTQSAKLIAVWTTLPPRPRIIENPLLMQAGFFVLAWIHAAFYRSVSRAWPAGVLPRGLRLSGLIFLFTYLFWEFFTPFNLLGEPVMLVALELLFWGVVALAEGFAIAGVLEGAARASADGRVVEEEKADAAGPRIEAPRS